MQSQSMSNERKPNPSKAHSCLMDQTSLVNYFAAGNTLRSSGPFTLKMVQAWPAWSAALFSIGWQFLIFAPLPLLSYLSLTQFYCMLVWKAGDVEPMVNKAKSGQVLRSRVINQREE